MQVSYTMDGMVWYNANISGHQTVPRFSRTLEDWLATGYDLSFLFLVPNTFAFWTPRSVPAVRARFSAACGVEENKV